MASSMSIKLKARLLVSLLLLTLFLASGSCTTVNAETTDVYFGVDIAYPGNWQSLIDKVSSYTNMIIFGSDSQNQHDQMCQYAYSKGMSFLAFSMAVPTRTWLENAKSKWGDHLLGIYYQDEPCGPQLDNTEGIGRWVGGYFQKLYPANYAEAADIVVETKKYLMDYVHSELSQAPYYPLFTSDYALYWFGYKVGYDVLLTQFSYDYNRQIDVALCRGAATVQNNEWGAIIVWKYDHPPYIESAEEMYNDLVLAYNNGAKYITVFDANEGYSQSVLTEGHYQALKQFWKYMHDNPRTAAPAKSRVAFVLPKGYGYGFRGTWEKVWGIWPTDSFALQMSSHVDRLLEVYGDRLDVIYDDGLTSTNTAAYSKLIYWNAYDPLVPIVTVSQPENKTYTSSNVSIAFTTDKPASWAGYSLDDLTNVTIGESAEISVLSNGQHNLTVYVMDEFENVGASKTVYFTISQPEPSPSAVSPSISSAVSQQPTESSSTSEDNQPGYSLPAIALFGSIVVATVAGVLFYLKRIKNRR